MNMEDEGVYLDIYDEMYTVSESMITYGGSFVASLGHALRNADVINIMRIKKAFPDYWEENLKMGKK